MKLILVLLLLLPLFTFAQEDICEVTAPNVISFSEENGSDLFTVWINCPLADFELTIFNRWGNKVFESNNPDNGWDGNSKQSPVPAGAYFWMVSYRTNNPGSKNEALTGYVTLMR